MIRIMGRVFILNVGNMSPYRHIDQYIYIIHVSYVSSNKTRFEIKLFMAISSCRAVDVQG